MNPGLLRFKAAGLTQDKHKRFKATIRPLRLLQSAQTRF